jgi:hypothetical protein
MVIGDVARPYLGTLFGAENEKNPHAQMGATRIISTRQGTALRLLKVEFLHTQSTDGPTFRF